MKAINVDEENEDYCDIDGVLFNYDKTELISYPNAKEENTYIIPDGVQKIASYAFTDVYLTALDISKVTVLDHYSFMGVKIDSFIVNSDLSDYESNSVSYDVDFYWVTDIRKTFCTGETAGAWSTVLKGYCVNFSYNYNGVWEERYKVGDGYIYYNPSTGAITGATLSVSKLDIPAEINGVEIVAIEEDAFDPVYDSLLSEYESHSFSCVTIPGSIKTIGDNTFRGIKIKELIINEGVEEIGDYAFAESGVTDIYNTFETLVIPDSVKTIGGAAFRGCRNLENVIIGKGVESIGSSAFAETAIKTIEILENVNSIGVCVFEGCPLVSIEVHEDNPAYVSQDGVLFTRDMTYPCNKEGELYIIPESVVRLGDGAFSSVMNLKKLVVSKNLVEFDSDDFWRTYYQSDDTFGYRDTVTRAMFVTILAGLDGADLSTYTSASFADVEDGKWYTSAIAWAEEKGYAAGIGNNLFGYKNDVTREQIVTFLYVYSEKNGIDVSGRAEIDGFADYDRIHEYALEAMSWAVDAGFISGTSETTLSPRDSSTRAEIALIAMNYAESIK